MSNDLLYPPKQASYTYFGILSWTKTYKKKKTMHTIPLTSSSSNLTHISKERRTHFSHCASHTSLAAIASSAFVHSGVFSVLHLSFQSDYNNYILHTHTHKYVHYTRLFRRSKIVLFCFHQMPICNVTTRRKSVC